MDEIKSFFIGPKSENGDLVEKLIVDILRDQFYWRKNYHPEDKQYISEFDKSSEKFINYESKLRQELYNILAELKNGTPFFSPRYIGHMVSETTIPSIIGYFAAMLYNPNNVSSEASPVTTEYEIKVGKMLCSMVGYDITTSWGHLTSGGTVANLEAMWVARNIFYLPVAIFNAMRELSDSGSYWHFLNEFELNEKPLMNYDGWELLNFNPQDTLKLTGEILNFILQNEIKNSSKNFLPKVQIREVNEGWESCIRKHSIQSLGTQNFFYENTSLLKEIKPAVIIVPQTKHYSYTKIFDLLGMGSDENCLMEIGCDENFRIDIKELEIKLLSLSEKKIPVMAVISVFGTTEEGSVDDHQEISRLRKHMQRENNISFYLHSDAAWGGYIASLLYENDISEEVEGIERYNELANFTEYYQNLLPNKSKDKIEHLYHNIKAMKEYDSITLDPHKLGYIPYAAGSILFRSSLMKSLLSTNAPYVFYENSTDLKFIGKYILEGSKPGAAACSCYLSHKVIPLNIEGYGKIINGTLATASNLYNKFIEYNQDPENNFEIIPISEPDTNILCFIVNFRNNQDINLLNKITEKVYQRFRFHNNTDYKNQDYIISKTEFRYKEYKGKGTDNLLDKCGINRSDFSSEKGKNKADGLNILRITCMNPLLSTDSGIRQLADFVFKLECFLEESNLKLLISSKNLVSEDFLAKITKFEHNLTIKIELEIDPVQDKSKLTTKNLGFDGCICEMPKDKSNFSLPEIMSFYGNRPPIILINANHEEEYLPEELESYGFIHEYDLLVNKNEIEKGFNYLISKKKQKNN